MKERCLNPKSENYKEYGGRGITVCEKWMTYEGFLDDMGERPAKKTIDRIDPNGNYEKANCRWASAKTQSENRRGVGVPWRGAIRTIADIARLEGIHRTSLQKRIKTYGDDPEVAVAYLKALNLSPEPAATTADP